MADLKEKVGNDFLSGLGIDKANAGAEQFRQSMEGIGIAVGAVAKVFGTIAGLAGQTVRLVQGLNPFNKSNWHWSMKDFGKAKPNQASGMGNYSMTVENAKNLQIQKSQISAAERLRKIEADRLATLKKTTAAAQAKLVLDKASAVLSQAQKLFDLDQIQLAAAMMKKQTDEDRARLQLKKDILDLETAINDGNITAAAKLAQSVISDAQLLNQLRGSMMDLSNVPNPFEEWLSTLQQMVAELLKLAGIKPMTPSGSYVSNTGGFGYINPAWGSLSDLIGRMGGTNYPADTSSMSALPDWSSAISAGFGAAAAQNANSTVNISINPAVAGLIDVIQNSSASGISPTVNRISTSYIA